jgi:hypothetical protein
MCLRRMRMRPVETTCKKGMGDLGEFREMN